MTISWSNNSLSLTGLIALLYLAFAGSAATAAVVAVNSGDTLPGTIWRVRFAAPITLTFDDGVAAKGNGTAGTLIEATTRTDNDALTITFSQVSEVLVNSAAGAGLRLNIQSKVTNNTATDWKGYRLQLFEVTPVTGFASAAHPTEAHFHPTTQIAAVAADFKFDGLMHSGNDAAKYKGTFKGANQQDPADLLELGDGIELVEKGGAKAVEISKLLLHERHFIPAAIAPFRTRNFLFVQTPIPVAPIPLPGALLFFGSGLLGLAAARRRR